MVTQSGAYSWLLNDEMFRAKNIALSEFEHKKLSPEF